jgi:uncharacterized protein YajQ (UPF0234 family)
MSDLKKKLCINALIRNPLLKVSLLIKNDVIQTNGKRRN